MRRSFYAFKTVSSLSSRFLKNTRSFATDVSNKPSVVMFGGNGMLGRHIINQLAPHVSKITVGCRSVEKFNQKKPFENVTAEYCDIRDEYTIDNLVYGRDIVINCVGLMYESDQTYVEVYSEGTKFVSHSVRKFGAKRFIQLSSMGANVDHESPWLDFKFRAEDMAYATFPEVILVRPSIMFSSWDEKNSTALVNKLVNALKLLPVIPSPSFPSKINPVWVEDVARAIAKVCGITPDSVDARGKNVLLEGPKSYTLRTLLGTASGKPTIPVPALFWDTLLGITQFLPNPTVTRDHLPIMKHDCLTVDEFKSQVVDPQEEKTLLTFKELGITPQSLESILRGK